MKEIISECDLCTYEKCGMCEWSDQDFDDYQEFKNERKRELFYYKNGFEM